MWPAGKKIYLDARVKKKKKKSASQAPCQWWRQTQVPLLCAKRAPEWRAEINYWKCHHSLFLCSQQSRAQVGSVSVLWVCSGPLMSQNWAKLKGGTVVSFGPRWKKKRAVYCTEVNRRSFWRPEQWPRWTHTHTHTDRLRRLQRWPEQRDSALMFGNVVWALVHHAHMMSYK